MRNLAWKDFSEQAGRRLNFHHYNYFGDVWVPANLQQGDIIRADLPTDHDIRGEYEICTRNCLVVGIDINAETMELEAIRVMRFSYAIHDISTGHEIVLDPRSLDYRLKIPGIKQAAILRTGKVEVLPIDSAYFGFAIDRPGRVDSSLFPLIRQGVEKGFKNIRSRHEFAGSRKEDPKNSLFVSGLDPASWFSTNAFALREVELLHGLKGLNFAQCSEEEKEEFQQRMRDARSNHILSSHHQRYVEIAQTRKLSREEKDAMRANTRLRKILTRPYGSNNRVSKNEMIQLVKLATREFDGDKVILSPFDIDTGGLSSIPELKTLLEDKFGLNDASDTSQSLSISFQQALDPNSLKDLETLGIGGLIKEPAIELPKQLWRGRYLLMRIPSLIDPNDMAQSTYRPCALWKAYAKKDQDGNPVLAGMELHPCTRGSSHLYSHKMKVRPLDTTVPVPSFLIANLLIRAPINAEYFQPIQPGTGLFYELLPHMVEQFDEKIAMAAESEAGIQTYGLQEIPKDWVEIILPEPPNERLRQYLGRNRMRFVGQMQPA